MYFIYNTFICYVYFYRDIIYIYIYIYFLLRLLLRIIVGKSKLYFVTMFNVLNTFIIRIIIGTVIFKIKFSTVEEFLMPTSRKGPVK